MLPSFLIIGASKAGTTWLQTCLHRHPGVFMPVDEIHYFTRRYNRAEPAQADLAWYEKWFEDAQPGQVIGENSNSYLSHAYSAERIKSALPATKMIAVFRNPIDRAYSDYCMHFRNGVANGRIEDYLDPDGLMRTPRLLSVGRYYKNLQPFLDQFPIDRFLFKLFEDVKQHPEAMFADICDFIGVDAKAGVDLNAKVNAKDAGFAPRRLKKIVKAMGPAGHLLVKTLWRTPLYNSVRPLFSRQVSYPPMTDCIRERLSDYYSDDVIALGNLIERDLDDWLKKTSAESKQSNA